MATLAGDFDLLPNELILYISFMLPITDVMALRDASYLSLPVLQSRIKPSRYLQNKGPFVHTENLFKVMATHNALLSGSRALDYFIPGSTTESSDWDFYVPSTPSSVIVVKMALEHSGVRFQTCLSRAVDIMRKQSAATLSRGQIVSIAYEAYYSQPIFCSEEHMLIVGCILREYPMLSDMSVHLRLNGSIRWIEGIFPISIQKNGATSVVQSPENDLDNYSGSLSAKVIHGVSRKRGREVPVQLIVGKIDPRRDFGSDQFPPTVFKSIFSFYASHVQCMLTKDAALHMYYTLALSKMAYRWFVPEIIQNKAEAAVQKYISRGYQFINAGTENNLRSAQDRDACYIDFGGSGTACLQQIKGLRWYHNGEDIKQLPRIEKVIAPELVYFGIVN